MKRIPIAYATAAAVLCGLASLNSHAATDEQPHALSDGNQQMQPEAQSSDLPGVDAERSDYLQGDELEAFFEKATANNLAAIESAKAALQEGSPEIRTFAQQLLDDHTALNEQLTALAKNLNIEIATDSSLIDQGKQWILERRDGESFDAAYLNSQITEHQQSIELFKDAQQSRDQEVSALAEKALTKLESHLETAKKLSRDRANAEE
ncbi:DUF4142 domain-containing protein [Halopseudomonas sp.]|uniref:DUF4142 domain-containing protein n=1 Tax=Halopseudomonas sp. TaxID=2901191 RepID=UPI003001E1B6